MPVDLKLPQSEWATLGQAVRWVAFGLLPRPEAFERLENYPSYIGEHIESGLGEIRDGEIIKHSADDQKRINAKYALARKLLHGAPQAAGRKGIPESGSEAVWPGHFDPNDPEHFEFIEPDY